MLISDLFLFARLSGSLSLFVAAILQGAFEVLDSFAEALAEIGQLAGAEEKQEDRKQEQQLRETEFSAKHMISSNPSSSLLQLMDL